MSVQKKKKSVEAGLWPENLSSPFYFNLKNPTKMETEDSKEFRTYTCLCNLRRKIQHESGFTNLWSHIEKQLFGTLIILVISKKGFLNLFPNLFPISWPRNFILQYFLPRNTIFIYNNYCNKFPMKYLFREVWRRLSEKIIFWVNDVFTQWKISMIRGYAWRKTEATRPLILQ